MTWAALVRTWNSKSKSYDVLTLRIEDTEGPGCLIRLYDEKDAPVGDALAEDPQAAMAKALQIARAYLKDNSITEESLKWVQLT